MAGDNRHVTENFLRLNFSPKPGITPGTNDFILMDCDQITARYYVSIAGVSSTGKRLPSQNQLSDSITLPTVSTGYITAITATTATGSGTVSADGGSTVTDRGVEWSIYSNFSVIAGSASSGSGLGSFNANITGLSASTNYYVRAYATNAAGKKYGGTISFTTTAASNPITWMLFNNYYGYASGSANFQVENTSASKIVILTINCPSNTPRTGGAPTFGGVAMTQVGSFAGSFATEMWYLQNPPSGEQTVNVPTSTPMYLEVDLNWYSCAGSVSLYNYNSSSELASTTSATVAIPNNSEVLTFSATTFTPQSGSVIYTLSSSDTTLSSGVLGGISGWLQQNSVFHSSGISKTMSATVNAPFNCRTIIASFVST